MKPATENNQDQQRDMNGEQQRRETEINERTKVPIIWLVSGMAAMAAGAFWLQASLSDIKHELRDIRTEMAQGFSRESMEIWLLRLRIANPDLKIPELPDTIKRKD